MCVDRLAVEHGINLFSVLTLGTVSVFFFISEPLGPVCSSSDFFVFVTFQSVLFHESIIMVIKVADLRARQMMSFHVFFQVVFLVACTRLYKSLCRSVRPSVRLSPVYFFQFFLWFEQFLSITAPALPCPAPQKKPLPNSTRLVLSCIRTCYILKRINLYNHILGDTIPLMCVVARNQLVSVIA